MIESLKSQGADYLVIAPQLLLLNNINFSAYLFNAYKSAIGNNFVVFDLSEPSDILSSPNQTVLNFQGIGALIGGYLAEPNDKGILNITSYYKLIGNKSSYYVLTTDFVDYKGDSLHREAFLSSELNPGVIMKNNYVLLIPDEIRPKISDVQFKVQELDVRRLLSTLIFT